MSRSAKFIALICVFTALAAATPVPPAETLDDPGIRKFYADMDTAMAGKARSMLNFMRKRMEPEYKLQMMLGLTVESGPPRVVAKEIGKDDVTDIIIDTSSYTSIKRAEHTISDIRIVRPNSLAYITHAFDMEGLIYIHGGTGRSFSTLNFHSTASCVDTLEFAAGIIMLKGSRCNAQNLTYNPN